MDTIPLVYGSRSRKAHVAGISTPKASAQGLPKMQWLYLCPSHPNTRNPNSGEVFRNAGWNHRGRWLGWSGVRRCARRSVRCGF